MTATGPTRVPPLMTALAQIGGLLAAINPDIDGPITQEAVTAAIRDVRGLRARVAELEAEARQAVVERRAAYNLAQAIEKRAETAEKQADELLWIESTSCCGVEANQYGVRAQKAEATVARVRGLASAGQAPTLAQLIAALNGPTPPGECGEILPDTTACAEPAGHALDAAGTPELASEPASSLQVPAEGATPLATSGTAANSQVPPTSANTGSWAVTDADIATFDQVRTEEGLRPALEAFAAEMTVRAALEAALGTPATEPYTSLTQPHNPAGRREAP